MSLKKHQRATNNVKVVIQQQTLANQARPEFSSHLASKVKQQIKTIDNSQFVSSSSYFQIRSTSKQVSPKAFLSEFHGGKLSETLRFG